MELLLARRHRRRKRALTRTLVNRLRRTPHGRYDRASALTTKVLQVRAVRAPNTPHHRQLQKQAYHGYVCIRILSEP